MSSLDTKLDYLQKYGVQLGSNHSSKIGELNGRLDRIENMIDINRRALWQTKGSYYDHHECSLFDALKKKHKILKEEIIEIREIAGKNKDALWKEKSNYWGAPEEISLFASLKNKIKNLSHKLSNLESKLDQIQEKIDAIYDLDKKVDEMQEKINETLDILKYGPLSQVRFEAESDFLSHQ